MSHRSVKKRFIVVYVFHINGEDAHVVQRRGSSVNHADRYRQLSLVLGLITVEGLAKTIRSLKSERVFKLEKMIGCNSNAYPIGEDFAAVFIDPETGYARTGNLNDAVLQPLLTVDPEVFVFSLYLKSYFKTTRLSLHTPQRSLIKRKPRL
jgi:hypothetical protein